MARPLKPLVHSGGWYPSKKWIPLVRNGGYTTQNGGEQPEPEAVLKTVTGSLIHITDALALPAEALTVNVEPIQDLHGYDSPWPAGGGANKLPPMKVAGQYTDVVIAASSETYTLNGNPRAYGQAIASNSFTLPAGTYYFKMFVVSGSGSVYSQIRSVDGKTVYATIYEPSFTLSEATELKARFTWDASLHASNLTVRLMIVTGSTEPTAWIPYSNICPISGRTSATVTRTGKNLANMFNDGKVPSVSSGALANANGYRSDFIPFKGNASFAFSERSGAQIYVMYYDVDKRFLSYNFGTLEISKTSPANTAFVMLRKDNNSAPVNAQLEYGTASDYEAYSGTTVAISFGTTVYGGTLDVTGGKMVVDRAYKLLNDADKWITIAGTITYRYNEEISRKLYDDSYTGLTCTIAPTISSANYTARWQGSNIYYFGIADKATTPVTSLDAIKAMATAGQIAICYAIEPVEITLTPTQIDMLLGENNLWADAGDLTLTYYADGNASTSEALGILLGGTYNNPGGADDVSDDEALGILLGGS